MDFLELVNTRYAVRSYTSQPVEEAKLAKILEAGRMAPTGGNLQPQRLVVVQQPEGLQKLGKAANIYGAPLAVIVCADTTKTWTRPQDGKKLTDIDASIVTDHMMLQATELGLASVWVCWFDKVELRKQFAFAGAVGAGQHFGAGLRRRTGKTGRAAQRDAQAPAGNRVE